MSSSSPWHLCAHLNIHEAISDHNVLDYHECSPPLPTLLIMGTSLTLTPHISPVAHIWLVMSLTEEMTMGRSLRASRGEIQGGCLY